MATIEQSMSLYDGVTGPLSQIQQAMGLTLNSFDLMRGSLEQNIGVSFNTQEIEHVVDAVSQVEAEVREVQNLPNCEIDFGTQDIVEATSAVNRLGTEVREVQNVADDLVEIEVQEIEQATRVVNQLGAEMREIQVQQDRMTQNQDEFTRAVRQSESTMGRLGRAAIAVNQGIELMQRIGNSINGFMKQADEAAMINSRIGMMNDGLLKHHELQKNILKMANDTRSGYAETVDLMSKLTMSGAFDSTQDVSNITESINKAIRIGGGTDEMNKSAMLQLSQALGSGVLQGDELRSLSENAPYMMKVLSDGLGVARGELKQMGADGELTTDVVIQAFENQRDVINSTFESIPRTWGDVTTRLSNSWTNFMQHLVREDGTGILNPLINQFYAFAEWLDTPQGMSFFLAIATVIEWITNGLVLMGNVVGTVVSLFIENWDFISMMLLGASMIIGSILLPKLWAMVPALIAQASALIAQAGAWIMMNYPILMVIGSVMLFMTMLHSMGITTEQVIGTVTGLFFGLYAFIYNLIADVWNLFAVFGEFVANFLNSPVDSIIRLLIGLGDFVLGFFETIANAMDALFGSSFADAINGWRNDMQSWADENLGEQKVTLERMDKLDVRDNFNKGYDFGIDLSNGATQIFEDLTTSMNSFGFDGVGANNLDINAIGSIEDPVEVSNEDLEIMRELAEMESIQNFVTLTPKVDIKTGPVSKDVDIDEIVRCIEESIENEMAASTKVVYGLG